MGVAAAKEILPTLTINRHSRIRDFLTNFFSVFSPMEPWHKILTLVYLGFAWPCCLL